MGKSKKNVANGNAAASSEMEDGNTSYDYVWDDDPSSPLLSAGKVNQTGWVPKRIFCQEVNQMYVDMKFKCIKLFDFDCPEGCGRFPSVRESVALLFSDELTLISSPYTAIC